MSLPPGYDQWRTTEPGPIPPDLICSQCEDYARALNDNGLCEKCADVSSTETNPVGDDIK